MFSPREREVVECLLEGLDYTEIGDRLFISYRTVKWHASRIYQKMKVRDRCALLLAFKNAEIEMLKTLLHKSLGTTPISKPNND